MESLDVPSGWVDLTEGADAGASLVDELHRELGPGHVLCGEVVRGRARCDGHCDDVVFELADGSLALVHLSYASPGPDRPRWPITQIFDDARAVSERLRHHFDEV